MSKPVRVYVCSEDYTSAIGTAEVVECYLEDEEDPAIILRDVSFDAEQILSGQVRALEHDVEYYKQARDAEHLTHSQQESLTFTKSEVRSAALSVSIDESQFMDRVTYFGAAIKHLGVTVDEDPEPTNAEKLEPFVKRIMADIRLNGHHAESAAYWAGRFDVDGVKAPGGDDDH